MSTTVAPTIASSSGGSGEIVLTVFYALLGVIGIFGNGVVLVVMIGVKRLHNVTNLFIVNQSIIDMSTSILLFASYIAPHPPLPSDYAAAVVVCALWNSNYFFWATVGASTFNLVLITVDRYFAVVRPITYRNKFTYRRAAIMAILPWLLGFAFEAHWASVNQYTRDDEGRKCVIRYKSDSTRAVSGVFTFIVQYLLPIAIMVLVYIRIERSLRIRVAATTTTTTIRSSNQPITTTGSAHNSATVSLPVTGRDRDLEHNNQQASQPAGAAPSQPANTGPAAFRGKARKNVIKTLLMVSITYIICWAPNQILFVYLNLGGNIDYNGFLYIFTVYLAFLNMCVNPFIYAFKYQKFQEGLKLLLGMKQSPNVELGSNS